MFRSAFRRLSGNALAPPLAVGVSVVALAAAPRRRLAVAECAQGRQASSRRRVLIDTDPGVDDALALLLAFGSPDSLQVDGLTIVHGNGTNIRELGANAKLVMRLAGVEHVPVSLGVAPPREDDSVGATVNKDGGSPVLVHGADSLGDVAAKYGRQEADWIDFNPLSAPDFIYDVCSRAPGEITLICIGPLSNIAAAIKMHPDLPELVQEIVIMGGSFFERWGNRSPTAEANFFDDPEAAQAVLTANFRKVVLAGLNITHQTDTIALRNACSRSGAALAQFVWEVCETYIKVYSFFGENIAPAHDAVPVMYLIRPDLFEGRGARVEVETTGELTRGMSVADWKGQWGRKPNCEVLTSLVDAEAFQRVYVEALERLPLSGASRSGEHASML